MSYSKDELINLINEKEGDNKENYSDWSIEELQELCLNLEIPLSDDIIIM